MTRDPNKTFRIAVVGGGAAGFFSAINCAQSARQLGVSADIRIFESSGSFLKKVKISGGGRCNVTHNCFEVKSFCQNYPRGSRELLSPMQRFQAKDTVEWFAKAGVKLVAEADGRMFPVTNTSETIVNCYLDLAKDFQIELKTHHKVDKIVPLAPEKWQLQFHERDSFEAESVLIATGSASGGYHLAESLGHSISERAPSLFSFKVTDPLLQGLQGLSFPEASLKLTIGGKKTFKQSGPTLVTHWGLSGPAILKLSAWAAREMKRADYQATLSVNWMGSESLNGVLNLLQEIKEENPRNHLKNIYPSVLPKRFWLSLLEKCRVSLDKQWGNVSKKELMALGNGLFSTQLTIAGQNRFKEEFVECGGVSLREIDFKTMQSKIASGIYFAGEILDVDGITGGFNFQNAWTTGWVAAQAMVASAKNSPA